MPSYDDCYLCHWHTSGAFKRYPGEGRSGVEVWCGAGRPEFYTGGICPTRLPIIEAEFNLSDHPDIVTTGLHLGRDCVLKPPVAEWMTDNLPKSYVETSYEDLICVRFDSPESYVIFKLFWL